MGIKRNKTMYNKKLIVFISSLLFSVAPHAHAYDEKFEPWMESPELGALIERGVHIRTRANFLELIAHQESNPAIREEIILRMKIIQEAVEKNAGEVQEQIKKDRHAYQDKHQKEQWEKIEKKMEETGVYHGPRGTAPQSCDNIPEGGAAPQGCGKKTFIPK